MNGTGGRARLAFLLSFWGSAARVRSFLAEAVHDWLVERAVSM